MKKLKSKRHVGRCGPEVPIRAITGQAGKEWQRWRQDFEKVTSAVPEGIVLKLCADDGKPHADDGMVRFEKFEVEKECSRLLKAATTASSTAKWTRLLHAVAKRDAPAEPPVGADRVHDRLCERLRQQTAAKTTATAELKAFEGIIVFSFFRDVGDGGERVLHPDLPLDLRSEPPRNHLPRRAASCVPPCSVGSLHRPAKRVTTC